MKLLKYLNNLVKSIIKSRAAQCFFLLNLIIILAFYEWSDGFQQNHFDNFPLLYKIWTILNIPAMTVAVIIMLIPSMILTSIFERHTLESNFITFIIWFGVCVCIQIQWMLFGYWIEKLYRRWQGPK